MQYICNSKMAEPYIVLALLTCLALFLSVGDDIDTSVRAAEKCSDRTKVVEFVSDFGAKFENDTLCAWWASATGSVTSAPLYRRLAMNCRSYHATISGEIPTFGGGGACTVEGDACTVVAAGAGAGALACVGAGGAATGVEVLSASSAAQANEPGGACQRILSPSAVT